LESLEHFKHLGLFVVSEHLGQRLLFVGASLDRLPTKTELFWVHRWDLDHLLVVEWHHVQWDEGFLHQGRHAFDVVQVHSVFKRVALHLDAFHSFLVRRLHKHDTVDLDRRVSFKSMHKTSRLVITVEDLCIVKEAVSVGDCVLLGADMHHSLVL